MKQKKLKTKDLIYAGAFAAIYMIATFTIVMLFGMIPILYILTPLIVGILCATIYMVYVSKVKKFGAILVLAVIFGVVLSSTGYLLTLCLSVVIGILAELVAKAGNYESKKMFSLSYIIFNLTMVAPFSQLYFSKDAFIADCLKYYGKDYANTIDSFISTYGFGLFAFQIIIALIGAGIGTIISNLLFQKHFEKAGMV